MSRWPHSAPGNRTAVVALVLGVHGLFVLLMLAGNHMTPRDAEAPQGLRGVWIRLDPLPPPPAPTVVDESTPSPIPQARREEVEPRPVPRTAITLPSPVQPAEQTSEGPATRAPVDWHTEAARVAAEITAERPTSIGKPLQPMREPCKPRVSSLWGKPKVPPPPEAPAWQKMVEPSAEVVTGVTRHTIPGSFSIPLGKPKPRDDLFDDMVAGATPRSSVPDPNICD